MFTVIRNIPLILRWMPLVLTGVSVVEGLFGSAKPGSEKKAEVFAWLRKAGEKAGLPWTEQAIEVLDRLIDVIVDILNFFGVFKHTSEYDEAEVEAHAAIAVATSGVTDEHVRKVVTEDALLKEFMEKTKRG